MPRKPCIKGTRTWCELYVRCLANGDSVEDILKAYPTLTKEDIQAALSYAAEMTREKVLPVEVVKS